MSDVSGVEAHRPAPTGADDPPSGLPPSPEPIIGEPRDKAPDTPGQGPEKPAEPLTSIIGGDKPPTGAPKEGYKDFTLPEGLELSKELLDEAKTFMSKDLDLSQDRAQKLVDFHVKGLQEMAEAPYQLWADTQRQWQADVMKDPDLGGSNLPQVKTRISKLLDEYGDLETREALSFTGAGNNPAIIRTLNKIAKVLTEGSFIPGSGGALQNERTAAQVLYPSMFERK